MLIDLPVLVKLLARALLTLALEAALPLLMAARVQPAVYPCLCRRAHAQRRQQVAATATLTQADMRKRKQTRKWKLMPARTGLTLAECLARPSCRLLRVLQCTAPGGVCAHVAPRFTCRGCRSPHRAMMKLIAGVAVARRAALAAQLQLLLPPPLRHRRRPLCQGLQPQRLFLCRSLSASSSLCPLLTMHPQSTRRQKLPQLPLLRLHPLAPRLSHQLDPTWACASAASASPRAAPWMWCWQLTAQLRHIERRSQRQQRPLCQRLWLHQRLCPRLRMALLLRQLPAAHSHLALQLQEQARQRACDLPPRLAGLSLRCPPCPWPMHRELQAAKIQTRPAGRLEAAADLQQPLTATHHTLLPLLSMAAMLRSRRDLLQAVAYRLSPLPALRYHLHDQLVLSRQAQAQRLVAARLLWLCSSRPRSHHLARLRLAPLLQCSSHHLPLLLAVTLQSLQVLRPPLPLALRSAPLHTQLHPRQRASMPPHRPVTRKSCRCGSRAAWRSGQRRTALAC